MKTSTFSPKQCVCAILKLSVVYFENPFAKGRSMRKQKRALPFLCILLLTGCTSLESKSHLDATADTSPIHPEKTTTAKHEPGVRSDEDQIRKSLTKMDHYDDRTIPEAKMKGLIDDGLYDPENEHSLNVGDEAPDFALMPLRFYDFRLAPGSINKENAGTLFEPVKLSSFRGNKSVVLIFGSYT